MISIIIPTLNEEKYLPKLLQSIKEQDFVGDLEVIVADAGSKDRTKKIARKFGCQIVKGGLPAKARNEGAKIARGELLLFSDADVILPKDFLNKALNEFQERKLDGASFSIYPLEKGLAKKFLFNIFHNYLIRALVIILPLGSMVFLVKNSIHKKIKGFNEKIVFIEDSDYLKRLSKVGKYRIIKASSIFASARRFEENGWAKEYLKVFFGNVYMLFFGPIKKDIFKYKFNHYDN